MKKRNPPAPMIFKKHEPRPKGITVFDKQGRRMTRYGYNDPHCPKTPLFDVKGDNPLAVTK